MTDTDTNTGQELQLLFTLNIRGGKSVMPVTVRLYTEKKNHPVG